MFIPIVSRANINIYKRKTQFAYPSFINLVIPNPSSLKLGPPFSFINFLENILKPSQIWKETKTIQQNKVKAQFVMCGHGGMIKVKRLVKIKWIPSIIILQNGIFGAKIKRPKFLISSVHRGLRKSTNRLRSKKALYYLWHEKSEKYSNTICQHKVSKTES